MNRVEEKRSITGTLQSQLKMLGRLINPVVNVLDIDGIVQQIDVNELAEKLDLNELIGKQRRKKEEPKTSNSRTQNQLAAQPTQT